MTRRRPPAVRLATLALVAGTAASAVTACSGDGAALPADSTAQPSSPTVAVEPEPITTTSSINRVDGDLGKQARERLQQRVTVAVDAWIDGAYGGAYPRDDFPDAFATFTKGAQSRAVADGSLMSNAAVGAKVDDVRPVRRRVRIDALAVDGTAVAVTARVDLAFDLTGEITRRDKVYGSLYLTFERARGSAGWRVFGYEMKRREA